MLSLSKHARWGLLLALAGCADSGSDEPKGEAIPCALDGAAAFANVCTIERTGSRLVIRRPDGGFRRFEVSGDRVTVLDGAETLAVTPLTDGNFELGIDGDRYRLPLAPPGNVPLP